jgi:hypothetical protein
LKSPRLCPSIRWAQSEAFTASEMLDVGVDLGSPVSLDYFDHAPFKFDGKIEEVVELK